MSDGAMVVAIYLLFPSLLISVRSTLWVFVLQSIIIPDVPLYMHVVNHDV